MGSGFAQKNQNIRDIERSLNRSEGIEKLTKLNTLTQFYKAEDDLQKLKRYSKQGAILARQLVDTNPNMALDKQIEIIDALNLYGEVQFNQGDYAEARENFQLAGEISKRINFKRGYSFSDIYIAKIDSLDSEEIAKENFFQKTFKNKDLGEIVSETTAGMAVSSELKIARSKEKNGKTEEAISHYEKALEHLRRKEDSQEQIEEIELKIAQLRAIDEQDSIQIANSIEPIRVDIRPESGTSLDDLVDMPSEEIETIKAEDLREIALSLEENKDYERSLEYFKMYQYLQQRLHDDSIAFLAEQELKEQELVLLQKQKEIADLNIKAVQSENQQQARIMEILTFGGVIVLLATFIILFMYFTKKRQHRKLTVAYSDLDQTRNELEVAENKISTLLKQQVSGEIARELIKPKSQGKKKFVCIMFLDIRDFTPRAETMTPEELIDYQNRVFGFMIDTIEKFKGNINQIMGDGFMATFGAPKSYGNDCRNAYLAAKQILKEVDDKNAKNEIPPTKVGIGLHAGNVVTGNVGTDIRKQYSVTGNTVIIASRVEQLNKQYKSRLIITEEVYKQIREESSVSDNEMIEVNVKGRKKPVRIIKVV